MGEYIELHEKGNRILVNANHIKIIAECENDSCFVYFEPTSPETQERITPDESYEEIKRMIWR